MIGRRCLLTLALLPLAAPAAAICSGAGLEQEFRDADLVVRARLVAATRVWDDEPSAAVRARWGDSGHVLLYRLRILDRFKGSPGPAVALFQEVNSGRFEIEADQDYLLFLNYIPPSRQRPTAARGATYVRHACGQSKPWRELDEAMLIRLQRLSRRF